jgi:hypothetical protein
MVLYYNGDGECEKKMRQVATSWRELERGHEKYERKRRSKRGRI